MGTKVGAFDTGTCTVATIGPPADESKGSSVLSLLGLLGADPVQGNALRGADPDLVPGATACATPSLATTPTLTPESDESDKVAGLPLLAVDGGAKGSAIATTNNQRTTNNKQTTSTVFP